METIIERILLPILFLTIVFVVILLLWACLVVDEYAEDKEVSRIQATVITISYSPHTTHTGVAPVIGGNGGVAVTSSSTSEKWVVVLKDTTGNMHVVDSKQLFSNVKNGQDITLIKHTAWHRIRLTNYRFGYSDRYATAQIDNKTIDIFGDIE